MKVADAIERFFRTGCITFEVRSDDNSNAYRPLFPSRTEAMTFSIPLHAHTHSSTAPT